MIKSSISHRHLRKLIEEIHDEKNRNPETFNNLIAELIHSNLIAAGQIREDMLCLDLFESDGMSFALLFTDIDEFRKFSPADEFDSREHNFTFYKDCIEELEFDGYIINCETEKFVLYRPFMEQAINFPEISYPKDRAYGPERLKRVYEQISNRKLEQFIEDPKSYGDYAKLFTMMCQSILLTLVVTDEDISHLAEDGVINVFESDAAPQLYTDTVGGEYLCVFTSPDKVRALEVSGYGYPQIINLAMFVDYLLGDDMDGLIINPGSDGMLISRNTLLGYSVAIETHANFESLNESAYYAFLMEAQ